MPKLDRSLARIVDDAFIDGRIGTSEEDVNSEIGGRRFLSRLVDTKHMGGDPDGAARTMEGAARILGLGHVGQLTLSAEKAGFAAVRGRVSRIAESEAIRAQEMPQLPEGRTPRPKAAVDEGYGTRGSALWVAPFFKSGATYGIHAGKGDIDGHLGLGGLSLGFDFTPTNSVRLGIAAMMGGGYAEGSGDYSQTRNSASFWGIGAYGGYRKGPFNLSGDLTFMSAHNRLSQELPAAMRMAPLSAELDSRVFAASLTAEYTFETEWVDITPHAGVKFTHLAMDGYDVESGGRTVMTGGGATQNFWSFPVGVMASKTFETKNGWKVKPSLDLTVTPSVGDLHARTHIHFTGVRGGADMSSRTVDGLVFGARAGIEVSKENLKFGLNYTVDTSSHGTEHGVFATFTWEF